MFSALHGIYGHVGMACPVGAYINKVNVIMLAQLSPTLFATETERVLTPCSNNNAFGIFQVLLYQVAQSCHLASFYVHHAVYGTFGTHAKAYEANPYALYRFAAQFRYTPLCLYVTAVVHWSKSNAFAK
jgi:hypothetical protein